MRRCPSKDAADSSSAASTVRSPTSPPKWESPRVRQQMGEPVPPVRRARTARPIQRPAPSTHRHLGGGRSPDRNTATRKEVVSPPYRPRTRHRGRHCLGAHRQPAPGPPRPEPTHVPRPDRSRQPQTGGHDRRPVPGPHGACRRQEGRPHPRRRRLAHAWPRE